MSLQHAGERFETGVRLVSLVNAGERGLAELERVRQAFLALRQEVNADVNVVYQSGDLPEVDALAAALVTAIKDFAASLP